MKPQMAELDIKIFLEGAYSENNNMSNVNHNCLPLTQPYKKLPWNYAGNEHVTELANDVVDWILVELRDSGDMNNIIERRAGILLKNGNIKDMDGVSPLAFNVASDNYFIVIKHRNHIPIISSNFVSIICK
jgi:hypothetical protein